MNLMTHTYLYSLFHFCQHDCIWDIPSSLEAHRSPLLKHRLPENQWGNELNSNENDSFNEFLLTVQHKQDKGSETGSCGVCLLGQHSSTPTIIYMQSIASCFKLEKGSRIPLWRAAMYNILYGMYKTEKSILVVPWCKTTRQFLFEKLVWPSLC